MTKIAIIGHFAFGEEYADGQTIKTKIVADELEKCFSSNEILKYDTHNIKKDFLLLPVRLINTLRKCKNVIILPAQNGLLIIAPLLSMLNVLWKRKLHYIVIGGWLPQSIDRYPFLNHVLKKFSCIYVETQGVQTCLNAKGLKNVKILKNCKKLKIVDEKELVYYTEPPYKICVFSRVMKEKGIEDAIEVVKTINEKYNKEIYCLDIYGQVDREQESWFDEIKKEFPSYVNYCGVVPYDKTSDILKAYFLLLFPTRFYTEGVPGTVIDAYAAGVPVIASEWENISDVIDNGNTGLSYRFMDTNDMQNKLEAIIEDHSLINNMKTKCIKEAGQYDSSIALKSLVRELR